MHGLHDLTENDDNVSLFSERLIHENSLLCTVIFCCAALPLCFPVFCLASFFLGMRSIITMTDVHSMTHTSPLISSPTPTPNLKPSLFHPYLIITLSYIPV